MNSNNIKITRNNGEYIKEYFKDGIWEIVYSDGKNEKILHAYSLEELDKKTEINLYNGHNPKELMESGRDILAEELLKNGEPDFDEVKGILPCKKDGDYSFLSGSASWSGIMIERKTGSVYSQGTAYNHWSTKIFSPAMEDESLGESEPVQFLLDGILPVMFSVHSDGSKFVEFMYFVEPGDPDRDPVAWIRIKKYKKENPQEFILEYMIAANSRYKPLKNIKEETFNTAFIDTVAYWLKFSSDAADFEIPEKLLERVVSGSMIACATTFTCDHAHYGHNIYGEEVHDNFPPNYIWALEACFSLGYKKWGKRIFEHIVNHVLNDEGRFCYRQGEEEVFGASAEEYGWLLNLIKKYKNYLNPSSWDEEIIKKLKGMGNIILDNCVPCKQFDNKILVYMCAEADTNTRVHAYVNNNFWAVRGLNSLYELLLFLGCNEEKYKEMADTLHKNISELIEKETVIDEKFGKLTPFRLGYPAKPYTLSYCKEPTEPMSEDMLKGYLKQTAGREIENEGQDLTENTYANYRYYLEMLGAMMLEEERAEAIVKLRENAGGEYMGMSRYSDRIDDWPVLPYARYLIESEKIEKYLLLLYSHTCHHGNPELMCYYEQITPTEVIADDCIPSLLTTPVMTAWMFAYELMNESKLSLLRAVPKKWFDKGFTVRGLGWSDGNLDISLEENKLRIEFSKAPESTLEIVWRKKKTIDMNDIKKGTEFIEKCEGNKIILKKGITFAEFEII